MTTRCFSAAHCCCCYSRPLSHWCPGWHLLLAGVGENLLPVCYLELKSALCSDFFTCERDLWFCSCFMFLSGYFICPSGEIHAFFFWSILLLGESEPIWRVLTLTTEDKSFSHLLVQSVDKLAWKPKCALGCPCAISPLPPVFVGREGGEVKCQGWSSLVFPYPQNKYIV